MFPVDVENTGKFKLLGGNFGLTKKLKGKSRKLALRLDAMLRTAEGKHIWKPRGELLSPGLLSSAQWTMLW